MRIACIACTHMRHPWIPDADVVVHAGDLTNSGDIGEVCRALQTIGALPHKHKIVIAGNHDWLFQRDPYAARAICHHVGVTYLQDDGVTIDGVRFWGSPWQPEFQGWAFNLPRGEALKEKWSLIPDDTDVLITHGPPLGIRDTAGGNALGCADLRERVLELRPKIHVFGHIHPGHGRTDSPCTAFVNACICRDDSAIPNEPILVDL